MTRAIPLACAVIGSLILTPIATPIAAQGCPPGLAKKNNGCTPPGLAKKGADRDRRDETVYRYRVGDRIGDSYVILREPRTYGLDPRYTYARTGDAVYRIDRDTRQVLAIVGLLSNLLN